MAHGGVHAEASPAERDDIDDMEWWHGWDSMGGYDGTTYGVRFGSVAYVLVPGRIEVDENGVIPTDNFMLTLWGGDAELKGFTAVYPGDNPDTVTGLGLGVAGAAGEGLRGASAPRNEQGDLVGEAQTAISFDGDTTLAPSTMGIGFVVLGTTHEGYEQSSKLFFNYSNIDQEPNFRGTTADNVIIGGNSITYRVENPLDYSEGESVGLRAKFGWDPTLGTGVYINAHMDGIERSVSNIVEALITTYPINLTTFPRTPPMKIQRKHISKIRRREKDESEVISGTVPFETDSDVSY
jgi:hypothetical protein